MAHCPATHTPLLRKIAKGNFPYESNSGSRGSDSINPSATGPNQPRNRRITAIELLGYATAKDGQRPRKTNFKSQSPSPKQPFFGPSQPYATTVHDLGSHGCTPQQKCCFISQEHLQGSPSLKSSNTPERHICEWD